MTPEMLTSILCSMAASCAVYRRTAKATRRVQNLVEERRKLVDERFAT